MGIELMPHQVSGPSQVLPASGQQQRHIGRSFCFCIKVSPRSFLIVLSLVVLIPPRSHLCGEGRHRHEVSQPSMRWAWVVSLCPALWMDIRA